MEGKILMSTNQKTTQASDKTSDKSSGRSAFRFLIFPKKQLKYAFFHFLIVSLSVLIINFFSYLKFSKLLEINTNPATSQILSEYIYTLSVVTIITLVIMGVLTFLITIVFLHRFVGPLLPIIRHLDAILSGNYSHKTYLRSADELPEITQKLNEVSDYLKAQDKK